MACDNCKSGFNWEGKPTGSESELAGVPAYVAGEAKDVAVLLVPDIFGWKLNNTRLLADHFAKEANATVYAPDLYVPPTLSTIIYTHPDHLPVTTARRSIQTPSPTPSDRRISIWVPGLAATTASCAGPR